MSDRVVNLHLSQIAAHSTGDSKSQKNGWVFLLPFLWLGWCLAQAEPLSVKCSVSWVEGSPHLELRAEGQPPEGLGALPFKLNLFDSKRDFLWQHAAKLPIEAGKPLSASVKLQKIQATQALHRADIEVFLPSGELSHFESVYFASPQAPVQSYGIRRRGLYPDQKLAAAFHLNVPDKKQVKELPIEITLKDAEQNVVLKKVEKISLAESGPEAEIDIAPQGRLDVGPFELECSIENDDLGIFFSWVDRVAYSIARVPVSSFEIGDRTWFACSADPTYLDQGWAGEVTRIFPPDAKVWSRYYAPELYDDVKGTYPEIAYDSAEKRSGLQSLRIRYLPGKPAHVFSLQALPGYPLAASFWAKGNNSKDQLVIHWRDQTDLKRPGWGRFVSYARQTVGALDFEGWRQFRVPVLGDGLQKKSFTGNTQDVDVPVFLFALSIYPENKGEIRSIWVDDLSVETQAPLPERLSLELRSDTEDNRLHEKAKLFVSIGNGTGRPMDKGRISLTVRDRTGVELQTLTREVQVPADGFDVQPFDLGGLHERQPYGPVDMDVVVTDSASAGARTTARMTFKSAQSYGLFWDFEEPVQYNGFAGGSVAKSESGGAEGTAQALSLPVIWKEPEKPAKPQAGPQQPKTQETNGVLLHPALPGQVDRMDFWVKAEAVAVELVPVLLDAGQTGVTDKNQNSFWLTPIRVEGKEWKRVEIVAPAVPEFYGEKERQFFRKPWYPLNLAFQVVLKEKGAASGVWIDNIRVRTHLDPEDELLARVRFPDDSRIHPPAAPLEVVLTNFSGKTKDLDVSFLLESYQQRTVAEGRKPVSVPAGEKKLLTLVPSLEPGIYFLTVKGIDGPELRETIEVLDAAQYFGLEPLKLLSQLPEIRKTLEMTVEEVYLDWDNSEPVPGLFHHFWFEKSAASASAEGRYEIRPVVGFSADWAGPEAQERLQKGTYVRYMAHHLQTPVRDVDWSLYVRQLLRHYKGRFSHWVFWENPDLKDAPQSLSPSRYPALLKTFKHWVRLYDPKAKVVAGGFNMEKTLDYLEQMEHPDQLDFDTIAVRMNVGELSPEAADIEGFLDELNALLKMEETGRKVEVSELDWGIGPYVSPLEHAAYHARASLILKSRGSALHRFSFVNIGQSFDGYGIFYRTPYGNSENIQTFKPTYTPKPAYFALVHTREFLKRHTFLMDVRMPDGDLQWNRAFLFKSESGRFTAVVWRTVRESKRYLLPESWNGAKASDAFGFDLPISGGLNVTLLPTFIQMPENYDVGQLAYDLRTIRAADGTNPVVLDLHVSEPDSCRRANYSATGKLHAEKRLGKLPGGRKIHETFHHGLESENFEFHLEKPGDLLLRRRWFLDGQGQKLTLRLNGGPEQAWDLRKGRLNVPGVRESTFVLRQCVAGENVVSLRYESPGNSSGYRLEPLTAHFVDLADWGILNAMQTKGELQKFKSASGTPLSIGKARYSTGLGAHAAAYIEYPLNRKFSAFEVIVGIDASTEGRGSVQFEIHADGKEKANSGPMNGFSKPLTLKVGNLEEAERLELVVRDGGDGNQNDLADWVEGKLYF